MADGARRLPRASTLRANADVRRPTDTTARSDRHLTRLRARQLEYRQGCMLRGRHDLIRAVQSRQTTTDERARIASAVLHDPTRGIVVAAAELAPGVEPGGATTP